MVAAVQIKRQKLIKQKKNKKNIRKACKWFNQIIKKQKRDIFLNPWRLALFSSAKVNYIQTAGGSEAHEKVGSLARDVNT